MKYEYEVLQVSAKRCDYNDPLDELHRRINDWANDGWRCVSSYFSYGDYVYVAVMEREVTE